eukprot:TRINITY_DN2857_c0_g1_i2.p1 TRINITY_DN2857_c0_g1~~TRINITY_DN2857_c0_g1_i2.p1  ORF type:complete len:583 (+),score=121.16 TRINITY_DN2857_c0_g1_i2:50-1798(+)
MGNASCFPDSKAENMEEAQKRVAEGNQFVRSRAYQAAVESYSAAIELYGKEPEFYILRGDAFARMRNYKKSCEDYSAALQLDKVNATALSRRAQCYKKLGNLEDALLDAQLAYRIERTPQNKEVLDQIRGVADQSGAINPSSPGIPGVPNSNRAGREGLGGGLRRDAPAVPARAALAQNMQQYRKADNYKPGAGEDPDEILENLQYLRKHGLYEEDLHARRRQQVLGMAEREPFTLDAVPLQEVEKQWYEWKTKQWRRQSVYVKLDKKPFSEGAMREAYRMIDTSRPAGQHCCVAKKHKKPPRDAGLYYVEVEMQAACQALADAYNANEKLRKKVKFVDAYLILLPGPDTSAATLAQRLLAVEPYIEGRYTKYNNNYGYVSYNDRNTPQAFSHFTYEYTKSKVMVVDIQGVGDVYTDPQIHTSDGRGFGKGNMGMEGINKFFSTHRCNDICRYLRLTPTKHQKMDMDGTGVEPHTLGRAGTGGFLDDFDAAAFIRPNLLPKTDYARAEELTILRLTKDQFNHIAAAFRQYDREARGFIAWNDVQKLLGDLNFPPDGDTSRLDEMRGQQISFSQFLSWWTGLA